MDLLVTGLVEVAEGVEPGPLHFRGKSGRVPQVQDRLSLVAEEDPGILRGEESRGPEGRAARTTPPRAENDVAGKIPRGAAETVVDPRSHRGHPEARDAALHEELARMVVELLAVERADHEEVVGAGREMREQVGKFHPALAVTAPFPRRTHQGRGLGLDEGEARLVEDGLRKTLAVQLVQLRLRGEEIELRGSPLHEDEDAGFRRSGAVGGRLVERDRIHRRRRAEDPVVTQHRAEGDAAEAAGRGGEEFAPGALQHVRVHGEIGWLGPPDPEPAGTFPTESQGRSPGNREKRLIAAIRRGRGPLTFPRRTARRRRRRGLPPRSRRWFRNRGRRRSRSVRRPRSSRSSHSSRRSSRRCSRRE